MDYRDRDKDLDKDIEDAPDPPVTDNGHPGGQHHEKVRLHRVAARHDNADWSRKSIGQALILRGDDLGAHPAANIVDGGCRAGVGCGEWPAVASAVVAGLGSCLVHASPVGPCQPLSDRLGGGDGEFGEQAADLVDG